LKVREIRMRRPEWRGLRAGDERKGSRVREKSDRYSLKEDERGCGRSKRGGGMPWGWGFNLLEAWTGGLEKKGGWGMNARF